MGFDVFGPTRHVTVCSADGDGTPYDVLAMPSEYRQRSPILERLNDRFYESTIISYDDGDVHRLRDELVLLLEAYRTRREPDLVMERKVRAHDPRVRRGIIDKVMGQDTVYRVLDDFRLLCEEAIAAECDVRCEGD